MSNLHELLVSHVMNLDAEWSQKPFSASEMASNPETHLIRKGHDHGVPRLRVSDTLQRQYNDAPLEVLANVLPLSDHDIIVAAIVTNIQSGADERAINLVKLLRDKSEPTEYPDFVYLQSVFGQLLFQALMGEVVNQSPQDA